MPVLCVGIDPAPSGRKGSAVVEFVAGESGARPSWRKSVSHPELRHDLRRWKQEHEAVLIAWDAPLTGPQDPDSVQAGDRTKPFASDFTIRHIERELRSTLPEEALGISVVGYAGCPHWTITRNLLGLPRVGPFDQGLDELPYRLLSAKPNGWRGHHAVEVHPAVAVWEWLKGGASIPSWEYKTGSRQQQKAICAQFLDGLLSRWSQMRLAPFVDAICQHRQQFTESADLLDALVAAVLATLLVEGCSSVEIRGDLSQGAMLLPSRVEGERRSDLVTGRTL